MCFSLRVGGRNRNQVTKSIDERCCHSPSEWCWETSGGVGVCAVRAVRFVSSTRIKKTARFVSGTFLLWFTRLIYPDNRSSFHSLHRSRFPMSIWVPANQSLFFFFWHSTAFFSAKLLFSEDFSTCSWVVLKMFSDFHNQSCRVWDALL